MVLSTYPTYLGSMAHPVSALRCTGRQPLTAGSITVETTEAGNCSHMQTAPPSLRRPRHILWISLNLCQVDSLQTTRSPNKTTPRQHTSNHAILKHCWQGMDSWSIWSSSSSRRTVICMFMNRDIKSSKDRMVAQKPVSQQVQNIVTCPFSCL